MFVQLMATLIRPLFQFWLRFVLRAWRSGRFKGDDGKGLFRRVVLWPAAGVTGGLALFGASSLDQNPDTGRWRLMCLSRDHELELGEEGVETVLAKEGANVLPDNDAVAMHVARVSAKVVDAVARTTKADISGIVWKPHVIKSGAQNAFVLPTGDIFVYTGLLDVVDNADQLAFVIGHEVAHVLGRHAAEKIGFAVLAIALVEVLRPYHTWGPRTDVDVMVAIGGTLASLFARFVVVFLGTLAYSRALETEADRVGQLAAARAGYDPREAKEVWKNFSRLAAAEQDGKSGGGGAPEEGRRRRAHKDAPEYLSTHPSHETRIANLARWEAECERARWNGRDAPTKAQEVEWKRGAAEDAKGMAESRRKHNEWSAETWYSSPQAIQRSFEVARLASSLTAGVAAVAGGGNGGAGRP